MAKRRGGPTLIQRSRRVSSAEKAYHHEVDGKVRRKFLGLSQADQTTVFKMVETHIAQALKRSA